RPTGRYTLSLYDALPSSDRRGRRQWAERKRPQPMTKGWPRLAKDRPAISPPMCSKGPSSSKRRHAAVHLPLSVAIDKGASASRRSEEHTSELQSRENLVC